MRRLLTVVACVSLIAALVPTMSLAAPPLSESESETSLNCEALSGDAGIVRMFALSIDSLGTFGDLALWTTGDPASTDPSVVTAASTVEWDGLHMTATFELVELVESTDPNEPGLVPSGTASFDATLAPDGRPQVLSSFKDRDGNRILKRRHSFQPRSVEGTLEVDLLTSPVARYDMSGCSASTRTSSSSITNPMTNVLIESQVLVRCSWETPDGGVVLHARPGFGFVEVSELDNLYFGGGEPLLTASALRNEHALFDVFTGEEVGAASASASLTRAEPIRDRDRFHGSKVDTKGWRLSVQGTLRVTIPSGTTTFVMDDVSCYAEDVLVKSIQGDPAGPKLKNDVPSDAIPLELGQMVSVWTGASATEPEAPCVGGGPFSTAISHTGWWAFVGTGSDVSIDTAGSSFDTILGVYLASGGDFEEVGCADDVHGPEPGEFSLQAAITLGTAAGTTYYVQAGGYGPAGTGQLVLAIY